MNAQPDVERVRVMTVYRAVEMFLADLSRQGRSPRTIDRYKRLLDKLGDMYPYADVNEVTPAMLRQYIDKWASAAPATSAQIISVTRGFFLWLHREDMIPTDPSVRLLRPKIPRYDERDDIKSVSTADVLKVLDAAQGWPEVLALNVLCYTGARRHAVAQLRLRDYNPVEGTLTFKEKGSKTITKPVPWPLRELIDAARTAGVYEDADDYLIPSEAVQRRNGDRDDRVIWKIVTRAAHRAGVDAHVHAFRAAFAVHFLEENPQQIVSLQLLLGHTNPETTKHYLRRLDRRKMMEPVRSLSWSHEAAPTLEDELDGRFRATAERRRRDSNPRRVTPPVVSIEGTPREGTSLLHDLLAGVSVSAFSEVNA